MLIDARRVASGETLTADVCIVGAGPAGITLAQELSGQNFKVYLLETGGFERDAKVQALAEDADFPIGDFYPRAYYTRERQFGGTANVWPISLADGRKGVRYVPLDKIDFEKRDWLPNSGWPITREDLDPYYERAQSVCQSGPYTYDPQDWSDETAQPFPFDANRLRTQMFQFGPADVFTHQYRQTLESSKNVTLCTYATVLQLETDDLAQQVTKLRVGTLEGNQFWVESKFVILAMGGLEVARLMMVSNAVQVDGLGNDNDLVGRYLMDHPVVRSGMLVPKSRKTIRDLHLYDLRFVQGHGAIAKAVPTDEAMHQEQILNICTALYPRPARDQFNLLRLLFPKGRDYYSPAVRSAIDAKDLLKSGKLPTFKQIKDIVTNLDDLLYFQWQKGYVERSHKVYHFDMGGWSLRQDQEKAFSCFEVLHFTEQAPDPANRIMLSNDRDVFGYPKMQLQWRWSDQDIQSIRRAQALFKQEFAKAGLGELKVELDQGLPRMIYPSIHHHMGTTRMHESPKHGVVDANCRVHGVSNLYVASSSVFPTSGYANPTLTIVAIAIRVADQIKRKMAQPSLEISQTVV